MNSITDRQRVVRVLDANINRAREALRVLEEYARLVLEDAGLTEHTKAVRHDLVACIPDELNRLLIGSRDIVADVGRTIAAPSEYQRSNISDVTTAATKRLGEALRTIEEYGKTIDSAFAQSVEAIRYRVYELEQRIDRLQRAKQRFGPIGLYVIITEQVCVNDWFETARFALQGGATCLQLREKNLPDRVLLDRAHRLRALCHEHDALFILNDRADIAALAEADGVHLGQGDISAPSARRLLPDRCIVGISTNTITQVDQALEQRPDYVATGPMFATALKPNAPTAGINLLTYARQRTSTPLVAIGGIDPGNAGTILSEAACTLCVCRAVVAEQDVRAAAARLTRTLDAARSAVKPSIAG